MSLFKTSFPSVCVWPLLFCQFSSLSRIFTFLIEHWWPGTPTGHATALFNTLTTIFKNIHTYTHISVCVCVVYTQCFYKLLRFVASFRNGLKTTVHENKQMPCLKCYCRWVVFGCIVDLWHVIIGGWCLVVL